jgi:hypothetical protein
MDESTALDYQAHHIKSINTNRQLISPIAIPDFIR